MSAGSAPPSALSRRDRRGPQLARIARLLDVDVDEVQGLDDVPVDDLRLLHDQISHAMYADGHARFAGVAALSKSIPGPVAGRLAERFLPPVLAARVSELLDPARARDLVGRVRIGYLADIAVALDPVRSRPVVQVLPADRIAEVAAEMFARREYAVMAEFVSTVTREALVAALDVATPHDLLAVVPLLEWNDNLDHVIAHLSDDRVLRIVDELDAAELASLAVALDPVAVGPILIALPPQQMGEVAAVLFAAGEYAVLAGFAGLVTPEALLAALERAAPHDLVAVVPLLEWDDALDLVVAELPDAQLEQVTKLRTGG